jgi:Ca2+-binding EF-hand superfamily protein
MPRGGGMRMMVVAGAVGGLVWGALQAAGWADEPVPQQPTEPSRPRAESFSGLDSNGDGVIDPREARESTVLQGRFGDADANRDGSIDRSEFAAYELLREDDGQEARPPSQQRPAAPPERAPTEGSTRNGPATDYFGALDRDGNGQLSRKEARSSRTLEGNFGAADQDNSGGITRSEFSAFEQGATSSASNGTAGAITPSGSSRFQELDKNGDGVISYGEAADDPRLREQFSDADTDLNGQLDRAEFAAFVLDQNVKPPEMPGHQGRPIFEEPAPEQ